MLELSEAITTTISDSLQSVDQLLDSLPEESISEFAASEYFRLYRRAFEKWVLVDEQLTRDGDSTEPNLLEPAELQDYLHLLTHLRSRLRQLPSTEHLGATRASEQLSRIVSDLELIGIAGGMTIDVTESLYD